MPVYQGEKDKKGNSWYFRAWYTNIFGERKQKNSKMYPSKTIAKEAERLFLSNCNNPDYNLDNYNNLYFEELYNNWWEIKKKKLKISNAENLKPSLDKNILNFFKPFKLGAINIPVLNEYLKWIEKKNLSISYTNTMISYCKECLLYGTIYYDFNVKIANYLTKLRNDKPKESPKDSEINFWTIDEFRTFINCVDDEFYKLIFTFLYRTGLRVGEFRAIKWNDIDLENKILYITKEIARTRTVKPKTNNSIRNVDLDDHLVELLTKYKCEQSKITGFDYNWYLFGGINYVANNTLRRHLNKYIQISGVKKITIHGFRHSHVSLLIHLGCDSRDVAERVGDTVQTIERTYYHMFPKKKKETINRLNEFER